MVKHFLISDSIRAQRNAWLIGDDFFRRILPAYSGLRKSAEIKGRGDSPYLFAHYNVSTFVSAEKLAMSPLSRMINCVIDSFNKYNSIPCFLVFLPDGDIVKYVNYAGPGSSKIIGAAIEWFTDELLKVIKEKKEAMRIRRPGSVTCLEPKVIFVKMIDRLFSSEEFVSQREKYNAILEETLYKTKRMYIMDVEEGLDKSCFEVNQNLNRRGKTGFWLQFDDQLKKFDAQETSLKPQPVISKSSKTATKTVADTPQK